MTLSSVDDSIALRVDKPLSSGDRFSELFLLIRRQKRGEWGCETVFENNQCPILGERTGRVKLPNRVRKLRFDI